MPRHASGYTFGHLVSGDVVMVAQYRMGVALGLQQAGRVSVLERPSGTRHQGDERSDMQATCAVISSDERTLVRNVHAPKTARIFVRWQLERWGLGHLGDVTELVASELVTNAIQHGLDDMIGIRLECSASSVVVKVWDGNGDDLPQLREPSSGTDEHGRGLTITNALSEHWGSYRVPQGGKVVYAMITEALSDD